MPTEIPVGALCGSAKDYLQGLIEEYQQPVCVMVLRLIAAERAARMADGDALKVLASLESKVLVHLKLDTARVKDVWVNPA